MNKTHPSITKHIIIIYNHDYIISWKYKYVRRMAEEHPSWRRVARNMTTSSTANLSWYVTSSSCSSSYHWSASQPNWHGETGGGSFTRDEAGLRGKTRSSSSWRRIATQTMADRDEAVTCACTCTFDMLHNCKVCIYNNSAPSNRPWQLVTCVPSDWQYVKKYRMCIHIIIINYVASAQNINFVWGRAETRAHSETWMKLNLRTKNNNS